LATAGVADCLPALYLAVLSAAAAGPAPGEQKGARRPGSPQLAVLVPAHNESELIGRCLATLADQDYAGRCDVVVIADNCTDDTAQLARDQGATSSNEMIHQPPARDAPCVGRLSRCWTATRRSTPSSWWMPTPSSTPACCPRWGEHFRWC